MIKRAEFDIEELKNTFRISNMKLERLHKSMSVPKWKVVVNKANHGSGYCLVWFNGKMYGYHAILWTLYYRENIPEGLEIDHINGNKIDNRIENLRIVTSRGNQQNIVVHRNGKLVSAYYQRSSRKYNARIQIGKKRIHLGLFKTEIEANKAYKVACKHIEEYVDNASFRDIVHQEMSK